MAATRSAAMTGQSCPFCEHSDLPVGCPYLDSDGNLIGDTECPSVCGRPATHSFVLPDGDTLPLCGDHYQVALRMIGGAA